MRAERLLKLIMLLQTGGRQTAAQLSTELGVSERTIYRDVDVLSAAGFPIYAEHGRQGGYALLDSYQTTLAGLTDAELHALFMLSLPAPLADLGVGPALQSVLLKLVAMLPERRQQQEQLVRQRIYLDPHWWPAAQEPVPHLAAIHRAIWADEKLFLTYQTGIGIKAEQTVEPYGLVAKGGGWYLVYGYNNWVRVRPLAEILTVRPLQETFPRPTDFELIPFWQNWSAAYEARQPVFPVVVRVMAELLPHLNHYFGKDGWRRLPATDARAESAPRLELAFPSLAEARSRLLALGGAVEVLSPQPLRLSMLDYARQITQVYTGQVK